MLKIREIPPSILVSASLALLVFISLMHSIFTTGAYENLFVEIVYWVFAISGLALLLRLKIAYYCFLTSLGIILIAASFMVAIVLYSASSQDITTILLFVGIAAFSFLLFASLRSKSTKEWIGSRSNKSLKSGTPQSGAP